MKDVHVPSWVVCVLVALSVTACDTSSRPARSNTYPSTPESRPSSAPQLITQVLTTFGGYPPFHGTLLLHTSDGDLTYEMWVSEPKFRVEVSIPGVEPIPWVSDGVKSSLIESPLHGGAFTATDPREIFRDCQDPALAGADEVAGRPVTGVSCAPGTGTEPGTYWVDDASGIVMRGDPTEPGEAPWEFTHIEFNPDFDPALFVVPDEGS
jgi:hypothetical protein